MEHSAREDERREKLQELNNYPQTINSVKSWRTSILFINIPYMELSA